jgi:hypothetical protein
MSRKENVRLGAGAGFANDRIDPARELAERGALDYLIFECLGERTVAAGQARRLRDPDAGYDPLLEARIQAVLPHTVGTGATIVTNSGSANPIAAVKRLAQISADIGGRDVRIVAVTGDDVLDQVRQHDPVVWETGKLLSEHDEELVAANAYIGSESVLPALEERPHIIVTGRLADPSLFVAPLAFEYGWDLADWQLVGAATSIGHLLECAGQLTGGYYADPVTKPVKDLAHLGFPFADVSPDGTAVLGKLAGSGGILTARTCAEQLLYEVSDPAEYLTPDVTADFTGVRFTELGEDRVRVTGATGRTRPRDLKVSLGFRGGWLGEGQISYAGPRAFERAQLAGEIVAERLVEFHGVSPQSISTEYIGSGSAFRGLATDPSAREVRLRVTTRSGTPSEADAVGWEVESLYTNGPAGGGGVRRYVTESLSIRSCLIPRNLVTTELHILDSKR